MRWCGTDSPNSPGREYFFCLAQSGVCVYFRSSCCHLRSTFLMQIIRSGLLIANQFITCFMTYFYLFLFLFFYGGDVLQMAKWFFLFFVCFLSLSLCVCMFLLPAGFTHRKQLCTDNSRSHRQWQDHPAATVYSRPLP